MNVVLLTGRKGSESIPGKNVVPVLGRPLVYYPIHAAGQARLVSATYVSTDCPKIKEVARAMDVQVIDRPNELSRADSELVDALLHALDAIGDEIDILVSMHCNCALHRPGIVDECIDLLTSRPDADSCVSGYTDRSVHPFRTKQIGSDDYLHPWMEMPDDTSTNRHKLSACFILDGAVRAMRVDRCFPPEGQLPFTYLGNSILPIENLPGGDIHSPADIVLAEHWLRHLGWQPPVRTID
ncbi:MAG: hypothetical protein V3T03_08135 [Candidatus Bipolaricaulota bacterium]